MAILDLHTSELETPSDGTKFKVFTRKDIDRIPQLAALTERQRRSMKAVSAVLPFRVNNYVIDDLIDWDNIPDDPIYQLTFPQPGMLEESDYEHMLELVEANAPNDDVETAARRIQRKLNPHPAGQIQLNVPVLNGEALPGMQHKYRETVLFFPEAGQTCHAYCTYCFRWAQFVGINELKFAARQADKLFDYVRHHEEVRSVLFTGGDPLVMKSRVLRRYLEPLLDPSLQHLESIRIGSKAPAYWPYKFVSDDDADDLLRLFAEVVASGRNLALMAHFTHPRELETDIAQEALRRVRETGAVVRCQSPIVRHVNDSPDVWARLWTEEVRLGAVPYYMFVERNTGAKSYFEIPLARAFEIFNVAYRQVSGLARTVRGPSMSAMPGKVLIEGTTEVGGRKLFALKFIQGRDPEWVGRIFFAELDPRATWLSDLKPAFGEREFFFEERLREIKAEREILLTG
ncbi:MAG TPA: lysine 2,3-aminomutase [Vicinamibacteria bacterium]|nr:lysine 2,3-aminomutase [Vicinamibacteria bacterium]